MDPSKRSKPTVPPSVPPQGLVERICVLPPGVRNNPVAMAKLRASGMYTDESLTKSLRPQTTGSPRDKYNPTQAPKGQNKGDSEGKEPAEQHYEEQQENELDRKPSRRPRRKSRQEIRQQQQGGEEVGEKVNQEKDEQQEEKGEDGGELNRQQDAQQSDKNEDGGAEVAQQQDKQGDHKGAFAVTDGQICVPIEMCRAHNVPRMDYVGDSDA